MAYSLQAFIGEPQVIQALTKLLPDPSIVSLEQQFVMLPLTADMLKRLNGGKHQPSEEDVVTGFFFLSYQLQELALEASKTGRLAYIEIELFAGIGTKSAMIWKNGSVHFGPATLDNERERLILHEQPHNRALQQLGVERGKHIDEFEALRLGRFRTTDQWVSKALT
jgi:hypothetical protein